MSLSRLCSILGGRANGSIVLGEDEGFFAIPPEAVGRGHVEGRWDPQGARLTAHLLLAEVRGQ